MLAMGVVDASECFTTLASTLNNYSTRQTFAKAREHVTSSEALRDYEKPNDTAKDNSKMMTVHTWNWSDGKHQTSSKGLRDYQLPVDTAKDNSKLMTVHTWNWSAGRHPTLSKGHSECTLSDKSYTKVITLRSLVSEIRKKITKLKILIVENNTKRMVEFVRKRF